MKITANSFVPTKAKIIIEGKSYTGNEFNRLVQALRPLSLNDNQQDVLENLKWGYKSQGYDLFEAVHNILDGEGVDSTLLALTYLSNEEQAQVLQAYANWALEQEEK